MRAKRGCPFQLTKSDRRGHVPVHNQVRWRRGRLKAPVWKGTRRAFRRGNRDRFPGGRGIRAASAPPQLILARSSEGPRGLGFVHLVPDISQKRRSEILRSASDGRSQGLAPCRRGGRCQSPPTGRERIPRNDHQKCGGETQSRTSEKNIDRAGRSSLSGYFPKARPRVARPRFCWSLRRLRSLPDGDARGQDPSDLRGKRFGEASRTALWSEG